MDALPHRIVAWQSDLRQMFGYQTNLAYSRKVRVIKIPAPQNEQLANLLKPLRHANQADGPRLPIGHHAHLHVVRARDPLDLGNAFTNGLKISERYLVGRGDRLRVVRLFQAGIDKVRSHALDLSCDVSLPGQRYRDHQNDACAPNDDPQHREPRAQPIGAQSLDCQMPIFRPTYCRLRQNCSFNLPGRPRNGMPFSDRRTPLRKLRRSKFISSAGAAAAKKLPTPR